MREVSKDQWENAMIHELRAPDVFRAQDLDPEPFDGGDGMPAGLRFTYKDRTRNYEIRAVKLFTPTGARFFVADDVEALTTEEHRARRDAAIAKAAEETVAYALATKREPSPRREPKTDFERRMQAMEIARLNRVTRGGRNATSRDLKGI